MKILFICDGLEGGGKERRFVQLIKGLNELHYGELYLLMTREILAYKEIEKYDIEITYLNRKKRNVLFEAYKYVVRLKPAIIQTWEFVPMAYCNVIKCIVPFKFAYSVSTAADCNFNLLSFKKMMVYRWSYLLADTIVGNSQAGLKNYQVPVSKQYCIYNGFDPRRLQHDINKDIRKELNIQSKYVITMMARFTNSKDWMLYVNTAISLLEKRNDITFLAVGDGEERSRIEAILPFLYVKKVIFLGRRNDVEAILRGTDISVLCSNPQSHVEGISNSILESMMFGVPVIATEGGGTSEIIQDGVNGFIIKPHDMHALSEKIDYLLRKPDLCKKMGLRGKSLANDKFSLEKATKQYVQMFESML